MPMITPIRARIGNLLIAMIDGQLTDHEVRQLLLLELHTNGSIPEGLVEGLFIEGQL